MLASFLADALLLASIISNAKEPLGLKEICQGNQLKNILEKLTDFHATTSKGWVRMFCAFDLFGVNIHKITRAYSNCVPAFGSFQTKLAIFSGDVLSSLLLLCKLIKYTVLNISSSPFLIEKRIKQQAFLK